MDVNGKLALVTGGTDGIGFALAQQLRAKGAEVVVTGRTPERLERAQAAQFEVIAAELSDLAGVEAVVAAMAGRPLALLVNNAGAGSEHDVLGNVDLADSDRTIWLNLNAPIHMGVRLLPALLAQGEAMIVNVTSGLAIAPRAGGPVYCASKAGLRSYTMALRHQLRDTNVHVLEVLPPVVDTKMTAGRSQKKLSADECAAQMMRAIARNADEANVGMVKILRAVYSVSPWLARRIMIRF